MANLFDKTPEEPRPMWMPVPPVFEQKPKPNDEEKPKPNDDDAGGLPPQIQNKPLCF
jgi:hypothetical protein